MVNDALHVVHARAAGLDVHKMEIAATVRLCEGGGAARSETRRFDALAPGLVALTAWLCEQRVEAAAMEATGVYWETPWEALTAVGIAVQPLHAQQVKQLRGRKTDIEDGRWLARVCQFGLGRPSFVPERRFRELRALSRYRRTPIARRSRVRNRAQEFHGKVEMSPFGSGRWAGVGGAHGAGSVFRGPSTGAIPPDTRAPVGGRWKTRSREVRADSRRAATASGLNGRRQGWSGGGLYAGRARCSVLNSPPDPPLPCPATLPASPPFDEKGTL